MAGPNENNTPPIPLNELPPVDRQPAPATSPVRVDSPSNPPAMTAEQKALIDAILVKEGGAKYTNNPKDKGGPTKFGITQKTLSAYRGKTVSEDDVKNLDEDEARAIYFREYIEKSPFVFLPDPLRTLLIDWSITSGVDDPTVALQELLNDFGHDLVVDGVFGPKTRKALELFIKEWGALNVYNRIIDARVLFYATLAIKDSSQLTFLKGWIKRALSFRQY